VARLRMQREEEAERHREERKAAERAAARNPAAARVANGEAPAVWRRPSPAGTTPSAPSRAQAPTPPRSQSPAPVKVRPTAASGGGTWREREAKKAAAGVTGAASPRPASPAFTPRSAKEELPKDDDGFQTVLEKKVWKPKRLLQQGR
jgi:translation initiation factor 3 subunit A